MVITYFVGYVLFIHEPLDQEIAQLDSWGLEEEGLLVELGLYLFAGGVFYFWEKYHLFVNFGFFVNYFSS